MTGLKGSPLSTIFTLTCPACQEGEFFQSKNPYNLKKIGEVHERCSECGQRFSIEPGFFFGAAYVSYALNVAIFCACCLIIYLLVEKTEVWMYITAVIASTIFLAPITLRVSRMIWATMFIPFGGEKKQFNKE